MSALDTILYYQNATINMYCICGTIVTVLGTIGGFFCLCVFGQKSMRKNPGSIYLIAFNISNILLIWIGLFPFVYRYMTNRDLSLVSSIYCRFKGYSINVLFILGPYYLVCASFDRMLVTSRNALTRQRSTIRLTFLLIALTTVFWLLFYIHAWFLTYIQSIAPGISTCFYQLGIYAQLTSYFALILASVLPVVIMSIFAIVTIRNFRQARNRAVPIGGHIAQLSSKDRQLIVMLLSEILISIILQLASSILFVYTQRIPSELKTAEQQSMDNFLLHLSVILKFIIASLNFYVNLTASKSFRKKFFTLISNTISPPVRRILIKHFVNIEPNSSNAATRAATHLHRAAVPHQCTLIARF